ncbi:helix-turn-helix transcriptional regulator [Rhodococcus daqingensis]|uniref:Helix-turn-helix transcriptional regulator n=1 Tax=Rhodococcus daqingensis TaxID=2479363 RepID=A0ABW2RXR5_9NOCA
MMSTANEATTTEFMTTDDVARERRISVNTLRYWRMTNVGPESFKLGRRVMYRRSEVEAWCAAQESASRRGGGSAA